MNAGQKVASSASDVPDPEVTPKAKRRIFSAAYKKKSWPKPPRDQRQS